MSRSALGGRMTCESCTSIDVRQWHHQGRLHPGQQFSWSWTRGGEQAESMTVHVESAAVLLSYHSCSLGSSEWKSIQQRLPIRLTACHLGGQRPCVVVRSIAMATTAGARPPSFTARANYFACRRCHGLSYASQQQSALHRGLEQARKIRIRLGGALTCLSRYRQSPREYTVARFSGCERAPKPHCSVGKIWAASSCWHYFLVAMPQEFFPHVCPGTTLALLQRCLSREEGGLFNGRTNPRPKSPLRRQCRSWEGLLLVRLRSQRAPTLLRRLT
jgi:hypothetical protein